MNGFSFCDKLNRFKFSRYFTCLCLNVCQWWNGKEKISYYFDLKCCFIIALLFLWFDSIVNNFSFVYDNNSHYIYKNQKKTKQKLNYLLSWQSNLEVHYCDDCAYIHVLDLDSVSLLHRHTYIVDIINLNICSRKFRKYRYIIEIIR